MRYLAYQLVIETPFPCAVLPPAPAGLLPDVVVSEGNVPSQLCPSTAEGKNWQAAPGQYLHRGGARAGRFLVEGDRQVTFQRSPAAQDEIVALHFLDAVLAAVLRHRGLLVLHANAAALLDGRAIAITGDSGAGKSTTLAALLQNGCSMLSDDITALRLGAGNTLEVLPGIPQFHLTEDAAVGLGQEVSVLPHIPWQRKKAAVSASAEMATIPAGLDAIYWIEICPGDALQITTLNGVEKFGALQKFVYGPLLPQSHPGLFPLLASAMEKVTIYHIQRPAKRWTAHKIVTLILDGKKIS